MKQTLLTLSILLFFSFQEIKQQPTERMYTVSIPEHLVNPFYQIMNGNSDAVSMGDFKQITSIVNPQLIQQNKSYALQDSIAAVKNKKDTTTKKP